MAVDHKTIKTPERHLPKGFEEADGGEGFVMKRGPSNTAVVYERIKTNNIENSAVTAGKIANLNVTAGKLATDSVTKTKIQADNIGRDKLRIRSVAWGGASIGSESSVLWDTGVSTEHTPIVFAFNNLTANSEFVAGDVTWRIRISVGYSSIAQNAKYYSGTFLYLLGT